MASSSERVPSRRQSLANLGTDIAATTRNNDADLSHSFNKLTLSTSPATQRNAARSPSALSRYRPSTRRTSTSPSSSSANPSYPTSTPRHAPSRSPSVTRDPGSRSSTPTLLRKASTSSLRSTNGRTPSQPPSRRFSLAHASSPPTASKSPLNMAVPEEPPKPAPTASSVASQYFQAELDAHHTPTSDHPTAALVILSDACYGHRFSRPKTSRAALSTIVERPERIKAGALGVAMAYVRLGDRYCDGAYPVHPRLDPASIPTVPFRIHKTDRKLPLLSPAVTNVHGTKWMEELKLMCNAAESKLATGGKELQRPDMNRGHGHTLPANLHEGDLYLCPESLDAFEGALGAVCEAVDRVFTAGPRRAFVGVRPPGHHCSASHPSGFCWINNVQVGIMHAILNHGLTHAAIIDFDLHHGDGSQGIVWQHNSRGATAPKNVAAWKKASIGYFSLHDINSYPCEMGDEEKVKNASLCIENAHGQNIWNVHLHSWDSEAEFWKLYESKYSVLLEKTRTYLQQQADRLRSAGQTPKAAIFFSAGFDASEWETKGMQRHNVNVPTEFYARITQDIIKIAAEESLAVDGRVISVLEGGYSDRALFSGIFSHLSGMVGDQSALAPLRGRTGLASETGQRIETIDEAQLPADQSSPLASLNAYDPIWWSSAQLDELEVAMGTPPPEPKPPRHNTSPTYSSPTQASTAKIAHPVKVRRSMSGLSAVNGTLSRPPTPPPPDVPWTTAVHELSKLLIPSGRQTDSCKAEDLKAEATRARRDRQELLNPKLAPNKGAAEPATPRMSLRERKPTRSLYEGAIDEEDEEQSNNRRRTVAGATLSNDKAAARNVAPNATTGKGVSKRTGRRLSGASSVASTPAQKPTSRGASSTLESPGDTAVPRPQSAMSSSTQSASSLTVKKTRTPVAPRGGRARATRGGKKGMTPARLATAESSRPASSAAATHARNGEAGQDDELEGITSGMKKIKINLLTKSQKEERERAALVTVKTPDNMPDENQPILSPADPANQILEQPTPPAMVTTMADAASPSGPHAVTARSSSPMTTQSELSTPIIMEQTTPAGLAPKPPQVARPPSSPPVITPPVITPPVIAPIEAFDPAMFVPYQPEGPDPVSVSQQDSSLKWLPPNTATPAAMRRSDLPVFTSTSAIPFARPETGLRPSTSGGRPVNPESSPVKQARAMWEKHNMPQE